MIEALVGPGIAVAEMRKDVSVSELFPAERQVVSRACARRRREFATGRACARQALTNLGLPPVAIPRGERGQPLWPDGLVGSITHCTGMRASAVAMTTVASSIGIDAEVNAPLSDPIFQRIAFGEELQLSREPADLGEVGSVHLDRLLFSAKEAVYKAWFQLCPRWLGFSDVEVSIDLTARSFSAHLKRRDAAEIGREALCGRWCAGDGLIAATVVVSAAPPRWSS